MLKLPGRRIGSVPALVVASYRDDEPGLRHPLRMVLGDLPSVRRLRLALLSRVAVGELAAPRGADADELYRKTAGNPFFVAEALALVRARRGDPEVAPLLDEAWELAEQSGELGRMAPVAVARAEVAWLAGDLDAIDGVTRSTLMLARERRADRSPVVVFYRIAGGGHTWPQSRFPLPRILLGRTSKTFDATQTIWSFLAGNAIDC